MFASLYATHGANTHRFQRRVIQFASIILFHAALESHRNPRVKKKVQLLMYRLIHAVATTPAQRLGVLPRSFTQPCQPSPKGLSGRPAHRPFRGLLGVHSRYGLHTRAVTAYRDPLPQASSHFVTSM